MVTKIYAYDTGFGMRRWEEARATIKRLDKSNKVLERQREKLLSEAGKYTDIRCTVAPSL